MNESPKATRRPLISKRFALTIGIPAAIIILLLGGPYVYKRIDSMRTFPLGSAMEYIGKKEIGCSWGFCDAPASSDYYYGTDLTLPAVATYLKANVEDSRTTGSIDAGSYSYKLYTLQPSSGQEFTLGYIQDNGQKTLLDPAPKTMKKYTVFINSTYYDQIKKQIEQR